MWYYLKTYRKELGTWTEDEGRGSGLPDPHDDSGKSLEIFQT